MIIIRRTNKGVYLRTWLKRKPSNTFIGNVNKCQSYGNHYEGSSITNQPAKTLKMAISLLDVDEKEYKSTQKKDTCTLIFITALFTIGKLWNWPRCPRANEWMMKMWYIYSMEYYS
jgi:hypothetical protein